jgi:hypothetical protein
VAPDAAGDAAVPAEPSGGLDVVAGAEEATPPLRTEKDVANAIVADLVTTLAPMLCVPAGTADRLQSQASSEEAVPVESTWAWRSILVGVPLIEGSSSHMATPVTPLVGVRKTYSPPWS